MTRCGRHEGEARAVERSSGVQHTECYDMSSVRSLCGCLTRITPKKEDFLVETPGHTRTRRYIYVNYEKSKELSYKL